MTQTKKAVVIGSGFAGLSAATSLAHKGWSVTVLEKHDQPGGRARSLKKDGYLFDMGPSWYWMPDVFESYFGRFGKKTSDYYSLQRLDPSYCVYFKEGGRMEIPSGMEALKGLFDSIEPGAGKKLEQFLEQAKFKYKVGIEELVYKPGRSWLEFVNPKLLYGLLRMDVFTSMEDHLNRYFQSESLKQITGFPVLFLGAMPDKIPALYSLMNYADMALGTWYPKGGMQSVAKGMYKLSTEMGVTFHFNQEVEQIIVEKGIVKSIKTSHNEFPADVVVSAADYHHTETKLLKPEFQQYSEQYWSSRVLAPSCLLYYVGINKKIPELLHHNLFFDGDFHEHSKSIYVNPSWPEHPLFYVCAPSVTEPEVAPEGCENLFILIPTSTELDNDGDGMKEYYFDLVMRRMEEKLGTSLREHVTLKLSYSRRNFMEDYHSLRGNAYGLANTLMQTAILKPRMKSSKVQNLYYTGQLTVPGPGVPPSLISGQVVCDEIVKDFR